MHRDGWTGRSMWLLSLCAVLIVTGSCSALFPFERPGGDASGACGNGVIDPAEFCDGVNMGGLSCTSLGYDSGDVLCQADCRYDVSGCVGAGNCGNGIRDTTGDPLSHEACDGDDFGDQTCESLGKGTGELVCRSNCQLDWSGCSLVTEMWDEFQLNTISNGDQRAPVAEFPLVAWVDESGIPAGSGVTNVRFRQLEMPGMGSRFFDDSESLAHAVASGAEHNPAIWIVGPAFFFVDQRPAQDSDGMGLFGNACLTGGQEGVVCEGHILAEDRCINAEGLETPMSTGDQHQLQVAATPDTASMLGTFLTWRDASVGPRIMVASLPEGVDFTQNLLESLPLNSSQSGDRYDPAVASNVDCPPPCEGGFGLVAWTEAPAATSTAIHFSLVQEGDVVQPGIDVLVPDQALSTLTGGDQSEPSVVGVNGSYMCPAAENLFFVFWRDESGQGGDNDLGGIRGRMVGLDGLPLGAEFQVNTTIVGDQRLPRGTLFNIGATCYVLVVWEDDSGAAPDSDGSAIRGRVFDSQGLAAQVNSSTDDFVINQTTVGDQRRPWPTINVNSTPFVVWEDWSLAGDDGDGARVVGRWLDLQP